MENASQLIFFSNNFGYNKENDILSIPHYAIFLLAENLMNNIFVIVDETVNYNISLILQA